jgi:hypothetical protein
MNQIGGLDSPRESILSGHCLVQNCEIHQKMNTYINLNRHR